MHAIAPVRDERNWAAQTAGSYWQSATPVCPTKRVLAVAFAFSLGQILFLYYASVLW